MDQAPFISGRRSVLKQIMGLAKAMKADAVNRKYAPAADPSADGQATMAMVEAQGPLNEQMADDALAEQKKALAELSPDRMQELLGSLK